MHFVLEIQRLTGIPGGKRGKKRGLSPSLRAFFPLRVAGKMMSPQGVHEHALRAGEILRGWGYHWY